MTPDEVLALTYRFTLGELKHLRDGLNFKIQCEVARLEAERQAKCPHIRSGESPVTRSQVVWHCQDCGKSERRDNHAGGAME